MGVTLTGARFWAVDLHTHTPASADVKKETYGDITPGDFVAAAIAAGLDAVAVTDHNTSAWCDSVSAAAKESDLVVLPGVEISTTEGHLLAIWEEGTPRAAIDELLVRVGISTEDQGKLDVSADVGIKEAARLIADQGGVAIAAHADRQKGLLQLTVAAHVKDTLLNENLSAVEVVDLATVPTIEAKLDGKRFLAVVRGSDMTTAGTNAHVLAGIGQRRTWIKAARPDLIGLRHALSDHALRVRLEEPPAPAHPMIESVTLVGGFLDGQTIEFSPDLNCLLGGTGAGKSLALEAIRYALAQQVDVRAFPAIAKEVADRLADALGSGGTVRTVIRVGGERYAFERPFDSTGSMTTVTYHHVGGDWVEIPATPIELLPISAFSQGEVLEYARTPVGRMALIDNGTSFGDVPAREAAVLTKLRENSGELVHQREVVAGLRLAAAKETDLSGLVRELAAFFDTETVKHQADWTTEQSAIAKAIREVPDAATVDVAADALTAKVGANQDLFKVATDVRAKLAMSVAGHVQSIKDALAAAHAALTEVQAQWTARFSAFQTELDAALGGMGEGATLTALRAQLAAAQKELGEAQESAKDLTDTALPRQAALESEREILLNEVQAIRNERREIRRQRAAALNVKTAGMVKLDISAHPDHAPFREALDELKVGSRVREEVLTAIASRIHPFRFARSLIRGDTASLVNDADGIDAGSVARLLANIDDRDLWASLLEAQICDAPDRLDVKFRKPDDGQYAHIEQLAHGQKCTAVIVVLLADGNDPVLVDQPEDALHAPWIEEYVVDRLRELRGARQYVFATRSPGIVIGADAEQIVTMKASAGRGEVEATGSLERHDLNRLALHHLEGGSDAFRRRSSKLDPSVRGD
ncbi:MAG: AAA family ATPase [Acidimicrobiia bacterium]